MELEFVRWLRTRAIHDDRLAVGPGDDAAVLHNNGLSQTVVTTDMLMDGVDFIRSECDPKRVGRKALAVNLSDLAAMAARPVAAFVSAALPRRGGLELAKSLYEGIRALADQYKVAIAGGDTNSWDGPLVISITLLGEVPIGKAWLRSGAIPGDALLVTGSLGGSILGKHFDFQPRVDEALTLSRDFEIHSAMDISDGLSLDLWRMCQESQCGAVLDLAVLPISQDARLLAAQDGRTALDHALSDGEDFELLLATSPEEAERLIQKNPLGCPITRVGTIVEEPKLFSRDSDGRKSELSPRGFQH